MSISNTMPELTETELRHKGMYTIEYYHRELKTIVAASYQSVDVYVERNGLPETSEYRAGIFRSLDRHGYFSDYTPDGHYVRVMRG